VVVFYLCSASLFLCDACFLGSFFRSNCDAGPPLFSLRRPLRSLIYFKFTNKYLPTNIYKIDSKSLPISDGAARFFGARCGTPCHAMPRFDRAQGVPRRFENVAWRGTSENFGATRGTPRAMSCHVYPKTWHGVALHTMPRATSCHVLITLKSPFYCRKSTKT
jgi:hypothetical protein